MKLNKKKTNMLTINNDKILKIEYTGLYRTLDTLQKKIEKANDIKVIKELCNLYNMLYKLNIRNDEDCKIN